MCMCDKLDKLKYNKKIKKYIFFKEIHKTGIVHPSGTRMLKLYYICWLRIISYAHKILQKKIHFFQLDEIESVLNMFYNLLNATPTLSIRHRLT